MNKRGSSVIALIIIGIRATYFLIRSQDHHESSPEKRRPEPQSSPAPSSKQFQSRVFQRIEAIKSEMAQQPSANHALKQESRDIYYKFKKIQMSNPKNAMTILKDALDKDPSNVAALADMADTLLGQDDMEQARKYATECLAIDVHNSVCHRTFISTYTRKGEFDEAYPYLSDCLAVDPNNIHCLGAMSRYHISQGNPQEAKSYIERLESTDPNSVWSHLAQAEYFEASGDKSTAKTHYEAACKMGQAFACNHLRQLK